METIKQVLMQRDGFSAAEAKDAIDEARREIHDHFAGKGGRDPEEILLEDFGLEPDYVFELLD